MLAKAVTHQSHSDSPIMKIAASNDTIGISEVDYAYLIYRKGDYQTATTLFETIIHKYPGHFSGRRALAFLYKCNKHLSKDSENLTLLDNVSATYPNKEIDALAKNISVGELIKQGDYQTAIAKSKAVTNSFADTEYSKYALFNLGSIYWYFLNDLKIGEAYYRQLIAAYPDDDLSISAMATLGEWNPDVPKKPEPNPKMAVSNSILKQFNLLQNYPNPFNPKTAIDFQIAKESKVSVVVYNLMGQKIRTLVEKNKQSGNYTVIWDGKNDFGVAVASGVYLYNLKAGKFSDIKKMILLR